MINLEFNIHICPKCGVNLQEYYYKMDSQQKFKRCPICREVYCINILDSNSYEIRNLGGNKNV